MSALTINLSDESLIKLQEQANFLQISPEQLASISLEELLVQPQATFSEAMKYVLDKNQELYQRLV
ncbi:conserved hypothetical protein [Beggiatoa sp. PS]|nr:conserved hypothetical protein [Beggiatoa sp. PS]